MPCESQHVLVCPVIISPGLCLCAMQAAGYRDTPLLEKEWRLVMTLQHSNGNQDVSDAFEVQGKIRDMHMVRLGIRLGARVRSGESCLRCRGTCNIAPQFHG